MFRLPLFHRPVRSRRISRQTRTDISGLQMDRLRLALSARGYKGFRHLYGNPDAYDYNGQRDNTVHTAALSFDSASEGNRFLSEISGILFHLQGPGTSGLIITPAGPGMRIAFNPLLAGLLARRLETSEWAESAVGRGTA